MLIKKISKIALFFGHVQCFLANYLINQPWADDHGHCFFKMCRKWGGEREIVLELADFIFCFVVVLFWWFLQIVRIILFALEHWFRNFVEEKHPFSSREICCLIALQCLIQCLFDGVCSHECLFSYVCWCCYIVASWRICVNERANACLSLLTPTLLWVCSAPLQRLLAPCWQCLLAMVKAICCGSLLSAHLYFLLHPPFFSFFYSFPIYF